MEAVRLIESGQRVAEAARSLGVIEQMLSNWITAHKTGKWLAHDCGSKLMEIRQLQSDCKIKMSVSSYHKRWAFVAVLSDTVPTISNGGRMHKTNPQTSNDIAMH